MSFEEWAIRAYNMRNVDGMEWDEIIPHFKTEFEGKTDLQIYEKLRKKIKQMSESVTKDTVDDGCNNSPSVFTAETKSTTATSAAFEPTESWVKENLNKGICIDNYSLAEQTKISDIVCRLKDDGYQITIDCGIIKLCKDVVIKEPQVFKVKPWNGCEIVRFGLVSDTHINSKYTQLTHLHDFYDKCVQEGIDTVYHAGDIDDGEEMRMGHKYECYTQGADDHVKEIIRVYPKRDGITTYFITGNHDASIIKRCGYDIGYAIAKERKDMIYLGQSIADIMLTPNCKFRLQHPWDGTAYSISYKPMKIIEAMQGGEKPNLIAIGNYHKAEYLPYRNVHSLQAGCFQGITPFMQNKGLSAYMGGWIIELQVEKDTGYIKSIKQQFIPYYTAIKDDYKNWASFSGVV